jgi:hypothetical protein
MSGWTTVTGDDGGLGIAAGRSATVSTGPSVTRRLFDDETLKESLVLGYHQYHNFARALRLMVTHPFMSLAPAFFPRKWGGTDFELLLEPLVARRCGGTLPFVLMVVVPFAFMMSATPSTDSCTSRLRFSSSCLNLTALWCDCVRSCSWKGPRVTPQPPFFSLSTDEQRLWYISVRESTSPHRFICPSSRFKSRASKYGEGGALT